MRRVRHVDRDQSVPLVLDQNEEHDQADRRADQHKQAQKQALRRACAIHAAVTGHATAAARRRERGHRAGHTAGKRLEEGRRRSEKLIVGGRVGDGSSGNLRRQRGQSGLGLVWRGL